MSDPYGSCPVFFFWCSTLLNASNKIKSPLFIVFLSWAICSSFLKRSSDYILHARCTIISYFRFCDRQFVRFSSKCYSGLLWVWSQYINVYISFPLVIVFSLRKCSRVNAFLRFGYTTILWTTLYIIVERTIVLWICYSASHLISYVFSEKDSSTREVRYFYSPFLFYLDLWSVVYACYLSHRMICFAC